MNSLNVVFEEKPTTIVYSHIGTKDIYFSDDNGQVLRNCKTLKISFDHPNDKDEIQHLICKFAGFFVLTSKAGSEYAQYIFLDSAPKSDIAALAEELPDKVGEAVLQAASFGKIGNMISREQSDSSMYL